MALVVVVRHDGRVRAVSFGLGGEGKDEKAAEDATQGWDDEQEPGAQRPVGVRQERRLAAWGVRVVTRPDAEGVVEDDLAGGEEDDGADARDDPDHERQAQQPRLGLQSLAAELQELREPVERVRGDGGVGRPVFHTQSFS